MVIGAATGGDRWGCVSGPPPVVVVVVVVAQGFKGDVLLKDWSVRHATSLSPIQTLPVQKSEQKLDKHNITCQKIIKFEIIIILCMIIYYFPIKQKV